MNNNLNHLILTAFLAVFFSCQKDSGNSTNFVSIPQESSNSSQVRGLVLDNNSEPIGAVSVSVGSNSTSTNSKGLFNLSVKNFDKREVMSFSKEGYFDYTKAIELKKNENAYSKIVMDEMIITSTFNSSSGTEVETKGAEITFPIDGYVNLNGEKYNGEVNTYVNVISPSDDDFSSRIPGGDLSATSEEGEEVTLYSFGMIDVVLKDENDNPLQIEKTANLRYPIALNMLSEAPNTIPIWHYDEVSAKWIEEGIATKNGAYYEAEVPHFSNWNFDIPSTPSGVEGHVYGCDGKAVENIEVTVGQMTTQTDSEGYFYFYVPADIPLQAKIDFMNISVTTEIPEINTNTAYDMGAITWCGSSIYGKIVDCNGNPASNKLVFSDFSPFSNAYSDSNGEFKIHFPEGTSTKIYVESFFGELSTPVSVPALNENETYDAGVITSCEDSPGSTSVRQDQENITRTFSSMEDCMEDLRDSEGTDALKKFLNLDEGNVLSEDWIDDLFDNVDSLMNFESIDDDNMFDFTSNRGRYSWDESSQDWIKYPITTDKIIIEFPSSETSSRNDAIFTFDTYEDANLFYDGENLYPPSKIHADLYIDNRQIMDITGDFSYDTGSETPIPIYISTKLIINPFNFTILAERTSPTEFEAEISFTKGQEFNTSLSLQVELAHSDYENIEDTDVVSIKTSLSHQDMLIDGTISGDLVAISDPSNNQINTLSDFEVFYENDKIGDLKLFSSLDSDDEIHIIYKDGTSSDIESYYDPFLTNLEEIFIPLFGPW